MCFFPLKHKQLVFLSRHLDQRVMGELGIWSMRYGF